MQTGEKENWEAFTPIQSISNADLSGRGCMEHPNMMRVAVSIKLRFSTLETNGKLREARKVTFNYFHLVVASQELDIERTGDIGSLAIWRLIFLMRRAVAK